MKNQQFQKLLENYRSIINKTVLDELKGRNPKSLYNPLIYFFSSGGKRLRSILLLLCANAVNSKMPNEPINQAIAIELLHNFTLIHDDIMDNSEKRHNKLTLHKKYDISTAILAGDALLALAYEFLSRDLKQNSEKIFQEFTNALTIVCEGQALDKEFEIKNKVSLNEYFNMISRKTGALIKSTCKIGALTQTTDQFVVNKLGEFGELIGIAFQIQDDLFDVIGDEKTFGKKKGSDLIEGKKTYLLLNAFKKARGKELNKIKELIKNKGIKSNKIKEYIDIYYNLGIIDLSKKEIENFRQRADLILEELKNQIDGENLKLFLSFVINRTY